MQYRVTASITFDYDSEDGIVDSVEDARQDVLEMLSSGTLCPDDFEIDVTESETDHRLVAGPRLTSVK